MNLFPKYSLLLSVYSLSSHFLLQYENFLHSYIFGSSPAIHSGFDLPDSV